MAKMCVVIRQLKDCRPVLSTIIKDPNDPNIDALDSYFKEEANEHIRRFTERFPEFISGSFYIDIIDDNYFV